MLPLALALALLGQTALEQVLPPGIEAQVLALLGEPDSLPDGLTLGNTEIEQRAIRFHLQRGEQSVVLVLEPATPDHAQRSHSFGLRLLDPDEALQPAEASKLLAEFAERIRARDRGGFWAAPEGQGSIWYPGRGPTMDQREPDLPIAPTLLLQLVLLLALLCLVWAWRPLLEAMCGVQRSDWLWLGLITAIGLGLRLYGGTRVPGHINGHGYDLVRHLLFFPPEGHDFHGNGMYALHGLLFAVLPRSELSVVGVHAALSALSVPLLYSLVRAWFRDRGVALWSALVLATLPVPVFYAMTEVRLVPGSFFLLLCLTLLGLALRRPHPGLLLAAALLGAVCCSFQPFFLLLPAVAGLLMLTRPEGHALLRRPWAWVAAAVFLLLYIEPAYHALAGVAGVAGESGPAPLVRGSLSRMHLALAPSFGELVDRSGNVLLNPTYTPPLISVLAAFGIAVGLWRRSIRWPVLALLLAALLLTMPGLVIARMNPARLQLAAQPLWSVLAGLGLTAVVRWGFREDGLPFLGSLRDRRSRATAEILLGSFLVGLVGVWSGPIGQQFTPQRERDFIAGALAQIPDGCTVVWPLRQRGAMPRLPTYLSAEKWRDAEWAGVPEPSLLQSIEGECLVYYRPAACHDRFDLEAGMVDGLRPECAALEASLRLEPIVTTGLPALPDHTQDYANRTLRVGFYAIRPSR